MVLCFCLAFGDVSVVALAVVDEVVNEVSAVADADCVVDLNARFSDRAINSEGMIPDEVLEVAILILEDMFDMEGEITYDTADM